ncbi:MAG TPA: hypothetical protein VLZ11_03060 [Flavobacterium sp.]|nr:hypothetical protein [Flavobacterium sp.]
MLQRLGVLIVFLFIGTTQLSAQTTICDNPAGNTCTDNGGNPRGTITPTAVEQTATVYNGTADYYSFVATAGVTYEFKLKVGIQDVELTIYKEDGSYRKPYDSGLANAEETAYYTAPEDGTYRVRYSIQAFGNCKNTLSSGTLKYRIYNTATVGIDSWVGFIYSTHDGTNGPSDAFEPSKFKGKIFEQETFNRIYTNASPGCNSGNSNFAIRYKMKKTYAAGFYKITVTADDGFRLKIGSDMIKDAWVMVGSQTSHEMFVCLDGTEKTLQLDYYQRTGGSGFPGFISYKIEKVSGILEGGNTQLCNVAGTTTFTVSEPYAGATWHSTNTAAATVNASGVVTRVAPGITNIQYRSGTCVIASKTVMVNYDLAGTVDKIMPDDCDDNGSITINPDKSNFRAARYWYRDNFNSASAQVGTRTMTGNAAVNTNNLRLTSATNGQNGTLTIANPGFNVNAVSADFDMFIGKGSGADGIEFSYGPLLLYVDTYLNGNETCMPENGQGGKAAISVRYAGNNLECAGLFDIRNRWSNINMFIDQNGKIIITLNGKQIMNRNLPNTYTSDNKTNWEWKFFGRTGAINDEHRIDNITIMAYNQFQYRLNGGAWQTSNYYDDLGNGQEVVDIRTIPTNALCTAPITIDSFVFPPTTFVFNGSVNSNWDNPSNWTPNGIPTLLQCVTIPTGKNAVVNISDAKAKNVTIVSGGILTVNNGQALIIKEEYSNSGEFIVKDKANLVQIDNAQNNIGAVKVERISSPMNKYGFTYWGTPVDIKPNEVNWYKQNPLGSGDYTTATTSSAIYVWGDGPGSTAGSQQGWHTNYNAFVPGAGFIARAPSGYPAAENATRYSVKAVFAGKANNGNINRTVVANGGNGASPYLESKMTFLSNPYPSAIDIDKLFLDYGKYIVGDTIGGVGGVENPDAYMLPTIYLWTHAKNPVLVENTLMYQSSDFATYTLLGGTASDSGSEIPTGRVASGQGFFVMGTDTGGTITFKNKYRYKTISGQSSGHNNTQFFRQMAPEQNNEIPIEKHRFWLNITGENSEFRQTLIGYSNIASDGIDAMDGAYYDGGNPTNLYTLLEDYPFSIQAFGLPFDTYKTIPLGYKVGQAGSYSISLADFDGMFESQDIYIKDNQTGAEQNLKQAAYAFVSTAGTFEDRLEVIYRESLSIDNPTTIDASWIVYADDRQLYVESKGFEIKAIYVYDMLGREIYAQPNLNATKHQFDKTSANQVLIIKVISTDTTTSFKKVQN